MKSPNGAVAISQSLVKRARRTRGDFWPLQRKIDAGQQLGLFERFDQIIIRDRARS